MNAPADARFADAARPESFASFEEFYPWYLSEHSNRTCRRLHVVGTGLVIGTVAYAVARRRWSALLLAPVFGYGFAWVGHFAFEKNKPATFKHPLWSLRGDFQMFADVVTGKIPCNAWRPPRPPVARSLTQRHSRSRMFDVPPRRVLQRYPVERRDRGLSRRTGRFCGAGAAGG